MQRCWLWVLVAAILPAASMADRSPKTVEFTGEPVVVKVKKGNKIQVGFPYPIVEYDVPLYVSAHEFEALEPIANFPNVARFIAVDPPKEVTITFLTRDDKGKIKPYIVSFIKSTNPDTYVDIVDAKQESEVVSEKEIDLKLQALERASMSPLNKESLAILWSQWGGNPEQAKWYRVKMTRMDKLMLSDLRERRRIIWVYEGWQDMYGYTYEIKNKSYMPLVVSEDLKDDSAPLVWTHLQPPGPIPPGGTALLHLVYTRGER